MCVSESPCRAPSAVPSGAIREIETEPGTVIPEPAVTKIMLLGGAGIGRIVGPLGGFTEPAIGLLHRLQPCPLFDLSDH